VDLATTPLHQRSACLIADEPLELEYARNRALLQLSVRLARLWKVGGQSGEMRFSVLRHMRYSTVGLIQKSKPAQSTLQCRNVNRACHMPDKESV
jgi:hypothetical protein